MPRGTPAALIVHWGPGEGRRGFACGHPGGGFYSTDWKRVTCSDCLAQKPESDVSSTEEQS